ncbi:ribulose-phosphate 3-epimerase [Buchnera aphidicola]|uniref:ribulose-phosphate 3-epimerase n=1 Tax=Buchnera aphidicola TaxID=9 RepID=UPI0031B68F12
MKKILLAPSILAANFFKLGEEVKEVLKFGGDIIHFDVMDNHYVPNITFGPLVLESLRKNNITHPIEVHLMVNPITELLIKQFSDAGATTIIIHPETTFYLEKLIQVIKYYGCKIGIALNPSTSFSVVENFLDQIDILLIMSVTPGLGGQKFLPFIFEKIFYIKEILDRKKKNIILEVDGGITLKNIQKLVLLGVDVIVLGTSIFKTKNYKKTLENFKKFLLY